MVRIIKQEQHTATAAYIEGACISTDTKPEKVNGFDVVTGSLLTEMDTGDVYGYNEEAASGSRWGVIASLGGGS